MRSWKFQLVFALLVGVGLSAYADEAKPEEKESVSAEASNATASDQAAAEASGGEEKAAASDEAEKADKKGERREKADKGGKEKSGKAKPYPLETCIVTDNKLGSMGDPVAFVHEGQEIKVCCAPCEKKFKLDPERYLKKLEESE